MKNFLLSVIASAVTATSASADYTNTMLDMLEYIETNSKYTYNNEQLPEIAFKSIDELCKSVYTPETYEQVKNDCSVAGYYDNDNNVIYIADEPTPYMVEQNYIEIIIFHELVHYLQYLNGEDKVVPCMNQLEKDAYLLQNQYVEDMNYPEEQKTDLFFAMVVSTCMLGNYAP